MGFNIAGLIINKNIGSEQELESLLNHKLEFVDEVSFEEATRSDREEFTIDVLQTDHGTLIVMEMGQIYDLAKFQDEVVQFIISDVSDTYYFEKYTDGKLVRKNINSQGYVAEDYGQGIVSDDEDLIDTVWEIADEYLQNNFTQNMVDMSFKRYEVL